MSLVSLLAALSVLVGVLSPSGSTSVAADSPDDAVVQPMIVGGVPAEARWGSVVARIDIDAGGKAGAASSMLDTLAQNGITHTPDGAPYSVSSIRAAMVGM